MADATTKTWLEVGLNGARKCAPKLSMPTSVEAIVAQAIACVRGGAAIVQVQAYDALTGQPAADADLYHRIIADFLGHRLMSASERGRFSG